MNRILHFRILGLAVLLLLSSAMLRIFAEDAVPLGTPTANANQTSEQPPPQALPVQQTPPFAEPRQAPDVANGTVTVTSAWITDGSGNAKTTFNPGDSMRYYGYVYNNTGSAVTAYFVWTRNGPCGSVTLYAGNLMTAAGTPWWELDGSAPTNCPGNYTYTLSVTYNGQTSSRSASFTVINNATCPTITAWKGEYWNNQSLSGSPVLCRDDANVNFDWGVGSPAGNIPSDHFSARWTRTMNFNSGRYRFYLRGDDGVRLWVDNNLLIDQWHDQGATEYTAERDLGAGNHNVKVEYYENGGGAVAQLRWEQVNITCANQYRTEYYNNRYLSGTPTFVQCEAWPINHEWGNGGPGNGVGSDNFSARWTARVSITTGRYTFIARADDGVRVWVDNTLLIDAWRDQGATEYRQTRDINGGDHDIKVEYYENGGGAVTQFRWEAASTTAAVIVSNKPAFDACRLPLTSEMQTWWSHSPYYEVNFYMGSNRGCKSWNQQYLTAAWIATTRNQGWNFIPTWVGLQAPCADSNKFYVMSSDPATAYNQGRSEADQAANAARDLGLATSSSGGTIIYYDMEAYPNNATCRNTVKSFISGWVSRLHELGNRAGGYGSACASYVNDWVSIPNPPDDIWPAAWYSNTFNPNATVWDVSCVPNGNWANHQRIRQYAGGHNETYGGLTLNIDSNITDGHVAGTNQRALAVLTANTPDLAQSNPEMQGMQLVSPNQGWVIVKNRLLWTTDRGTRWTDITPHTEQTFTLRNTFFLDQATGWLIFAANQTNEDQTQLLVASTTDGGATWQTTPLPTSTSGGYAVSSSAYLNFIDAHTGWVSVKFASSSNFSFGTLFKTTDGGQTWTELSLPLGEPVRFVSSDVGWVAGGASGNELYMTQDGGRTWTAQPVAAERNSVQSLFYDLPTFKNAQEGVLPITVASPDHSRIELYTTHNGGQAWNLATTVAITSSAAPGAKVPVKVFNMQNWLVSNAGTDEFLTTADGGRTTNSIRASAASQSSSIVALDFATPTIGWVQTASNTCSGSKSEADDTFHCEFHTAFLRTEDGGQTWREMKPMDSSTERVFLPAVTK